MVKSEGMRRIFFKGLKFQSLLCVYAHMFPTVLDSFSLCYTNLILWNYLHAFSHVYWNPPQNSILCIGRCLQCRPLIGCNENALNWLVTSSFWYDLLVLRRFSACFYRAKIAAVESWRRFLKWFPKLVCNFIDASKNMNFLGHSQCAAVFFIITAPLHSTPPENM
jgi:hypothetical protein